VGHARIKHRHQKAVSFSCFHFCISRGIAQAAKAVERQVRASTRDTVPEKYKNESRRSAIFLIVVDNIRILNARTLART
jgi:hypothetical protein